MRAERETHLKCTGERRMEERPYGSYEKPSGLRPVCPCSDIKRFSLAWPCVASRRAGSCSALCPTCREAVMDPGPDCRALLGLSPSVRRASSRCARSLSVPRGPLLGPASQQHLKAWQPHTVARTAQVLTQSAKSHVRPSSAVSNTLRC